MTEAKTGIVSVWAVSPSGSGQQVPLADLGVPPKSGYHWIHLDKDHEDAINWLRNASGLSPEVCDIMLAPDSRPRTLLLDEEVLINLRGVNLNPESDVEDMVGIRLCVTKNRIISVRKRKLLAAQDLAKQLELGRGPGNTGAFMARLGLLLADRMSPTITQLNESVDDLEERILEGVDSELKNNVSDLRRKSILLRRYLAPQREALATLSLQGMDWISEKDILRIREAADHTTRITEDLDAARERLSIVYDQLVDIRSEQMNRLMLVLSIVAAIFLPLGLVAGMLGMNVGGVPGEGQQAAFMWVTMGMIIAGLTQFAIFKWMKWI